MGGGNSHADGWAEAPPIVVVAKSAQLRFRLRRKLRPLPCSSSPHRAVRGGGPIFGLAEKKTGRARSKRKERLLSRSGTFVPPRCTGVGVRWCLRVCEDWPTGAAGYGTGLIVGSRGAVHLKSGCKEAFDLLLFPRVPLARKGHAASVSGKAANGCAVATRSPGGRRSCCVVLC